MTGNVLQPQQPQGTTHHNNNSIHWDDDNTGTHSQSSSTDSSIHHHHLTHDDIESSTMFTVALQNTSSYHQTDLPSSSSSSLSWRKQSSSTTDNKTVINNDIHMNKKNKKIRHNKVLRCHKILSITATPWFVSLFIFVILMVSGINTIRIFGNQREQEIRDKASELATETGDFFSDQLDRAILPLFSIAQFATNLEIFKELPDKIGVAGQPNSLPFINGTYNRNITGVCDDPELVSNFVSIASAIKKHAKMDGLLVNIQLVPEGVVCLLHPLNNTEDFEEGEFLDNTGAWGLDLFSDPNMNYIAHQNIQTTEVGIAGPLQLRQCPTCDPFFIARLPIVDESHQIYVDGIPYNRWGFATALIHWKKLVDESGIYERFENEMFEFQLTRTDRNFDQETDSYQEVVVVLAETEGFNDQTGKTESVSESLETTNNVWEITVLYSNIEVTQWNAGLFAACGVVSLCMSFMIYMILTQKQQHANMRADTREKEAKIETERNITAYFAHELRNPLSAMDNALTIIADNALPPNTREIVDAMQRCSAFMSGIMNNLLDVRKIEEGKMEIRCNPFSLAALVGDTHKMLSSLVKPRVQFLVDNQIPPHQNWVFGDTHRLQQVLVNVTTNAIKYTQEGSITLKASWEGKNVKLQCIDTGPGIPLSAQANLFERFVQRGGAPGTGLGLAISKQIVEVMGGSIQFESDPTVKPGTTCVIILPLRICEQQEEDSSKFEKTKIIEEEISILIMDDIKLNRMMLSRRIKKFIAPNSKITMVETAEKASELCEKQSFDIMICDQYLEEAGGVMVGTDFIVAARRNGSNSLIVGCSGNDLSNAFMDAGADMVWGKPLPKNDEILTQWRSGLTEKQVLS